MNVVPLAPEIAGSDELDVRNDEFGVFLALARRCV